MPDPCNVQLEFTGGSRTESSTITLDTSAAKTYGTKTFIDQVVKVPAWATKVNVTCPSCEVDEGESPITRQEAVDHFERLCKARWRNLTLKHLNEWSYDGMMIAAEARFKDDSSSVEPFIDGLAWWKHNEYEGVDLDGKEKSLFGKKEYQLPQDTVGQLEQMHPITVLWLWGLLCDPYPDPNEETGVVDAISVVSPHATFVSSLDEFRSVYDLDAVEIKAAYAGFMPATDSPPELRVGDQLSAFVVSDGMTEYQPDVQAGVTVQLERLDEPVEDETPDGAAAVHRSFRLKSFRLLSSDALFLTSRA